MQFSHQDIRLLYGSRLYLVPEPEKPVEETVVEEIVDELPVVPDYSLLEQGSPVVWKLKPQAQLVFVLREAEFANRELTKMLGAEVAAAGIDTSKIGFGVLAGEGPGWDFSKMEVPVALICHDFGQGWENAIVWNGKRISFAPSLQQAQQDSASKDLLLQALKAIQVHLPS